MNMRNKSVTCALLIGAITLGPAMARSHPRATTGGPQPTQPSSATVQRAVPVASKASLPDEVVDRFIDASRAVDRLRQAYANGTIEARSNNPSDLAAEITAAVEGTVEAYGFDLAEYQAIGERLERDHTALRPVHASPV